MAAKNRRIQAKQDRVTVEGVVLEHQREMMGVVLTMSTAIVFLSLVSFRPDDPVLQSISNRPANMVGLVGAYLANGLLEVLGLMSFLVAAVLGWAAMAAFGFKLARPSVKNVVGVITLILQGSVLGHLVWNGRLVLGHTAGGLLGESVTGLLVSLFSDIGTAIICSAGFLLSLVAVVGVSPSRAIAVFAVGVKRATVFFGIYASRGIQAAGRACWRMAKAAAIFLLSEGREVISVLRRRETAEVLEHAELVSDPLGCDAARANVEAEFVEPCEMAAPVVSLPSEPLVVTGEIPPPAEEPAEKKSFGKVRREREPEIVIPQVEPALPLESQGPPKNSGGRPAMDLRDYQLPHLDLLDMHPQSETEVEKEQLQQYARRLEEKLANYGVEGHVTKIMPGPVVTMYEYVPADGVKVSKIAGLSNDLALALGANSVRIVAPIPGRTVVGIEVANKDRQTVYAKEIIGHQVFQRSKSKLALALGKNIEGAPFVTDLNQMPRLLVAGATGTGKSVALNTMIVSILYRCTPQDVRFILVDPKVLELSLYEGIPHLLLPVVTDPRKAQAALLWAVGEMERRIGLLHEAGVRNLDAYNRKLERLQPQGGTSDAPTGEKKVIVIDRTGDPEQPLPKQEKPAVAEEKPSAAPSPTPEKLPHIIIVIDELADLMMTSGREAETAIARIAQKARAAGIHLIVATQRPSVNVITGLIKANLPARISFRVASKVDSRTILDSNGAETLLGNGDMLFHPPTSAELVRIHGALITEEEITRVVEHLKKQAQPVYDESILSAATAEPESEAGETEEDSDELYDLAVALVAELGQASTSLVQRKLRIGYNRAARLIERMEREGIVGPAEGVRPRPVLIQDVRP